MAKERKRLINEDLVSDVPTAVIGPGIACLWIQNYYVVFIQTFFQIQNHFVALLAIPVDLKNYHQYQIIKTSFCIRFHAVYFIKFPISCKNQIVVKNENNNALN
jgi:hypothetical protein